MKETGIIVCDLIFSFRHSLVSKNSIEMDVLNGPCHPLGAYLCDIGDMLEKCAVSAFCKNLTVKKKRAVIFFGCSIIHFSTFLNTFGAQVAALDDVSLAFLIQFLCFTLQVCEYLADRGGFLSSKF